MSSDELKPWNNNIKEKMRKTTKKCNVCNGNVISMPNFGNSPNTDQYSWEDRDWKRYTRDRYWLEYKKCKKNEQHSHIQLANARSFCTICTSKTSLFTGVWPFSGRM